jgi:hypothetical protein
MYVGVGATMFDRLVASGRMPAPRKIDSRKVWDIRALDVAFDQLPSEAGAQTGTSSSWDDAR